MMTERVLMRTTEVERIPAHPGNLFFQEHLARYDFAKPHVRPGRILDIACGTGYGTDLFAHLPELSAVGVDLDRASIHAARKAYPDPITHFCIASATQLPFPARSFSTIVSLETIEHVADDRSLVREFARLLTPDGACIISTPNRRYSLEQNIVNPYHVREYVETELRGLLT
jgi:2-polyprenyl-3-methyl-5-hydroxy-6-metoxy-1,4-benzoquinol methylase